MTFINEIARRLTAPIVITDIKNDFSIDEHHATIKFLYLGEENTGFWSYSDGFTVNTRFNDTRVNNHIIKLFKALTVFNNGLTLIEY